MQAKLNSQQTDLIAARRELADAQQLSELTETRLLDSQEQLEMAMLDKEVAEERAEAAEAEVEELKEKLAEVEVELGVLKEEGGGGGLQTLRFITTFITSPFVSKEGARPAGRPISRVLCNSFSWRSKILA